MGTSFVNPPAPQSQTLSTTDSTTQSFADLLQPQDTVPSVEQPSTPALLPFSSISQVGLRHDASYANKFFPCGHPLQHADANLTLGEIAAAQALVAMQSTAAPPTSSKSRQNDIPMGMAHTSSEFSSNINSTPKDFDVDLEDTLETIKGVKKISKASAPKHAIKNLQGIRKRHSAGKRAIKLSDPTKALRYMSMIAQEDASPALSAGPAAIAYGTSIEQPVFEAATYHDSKTNQDLFYTLNLQNIRITALNLFPIQLPRSPLLPTRGREVW